MTDRVFREARFQRLSGLLAAAGLAILLLLAASCGETSASAQSVSVAEITDASRDTTQTNDFLRYSYVSSGTSVTTLGRPGALRAFFTVTAFFHSPPPLQEAVTYPGLADQPAQDLVVLRCIPPDKSKVDAILATWPNVLAAVQRDLADQHPSCPYSGNTGANEVYCIAQSYSDTPNSNVTAALANTYDTANTLFDAAHPERASWLKTNYGIYPAFSGLGFSVKDSYFLSLDNPMTSAQMLQKSVAPEYLLQNVSLSDAGCRCIRLAPYTGRSEATIDPDFVWKNGGQGSCTTVPQETTR